MLAVIRSRRPGSLIPTNPQIPHISVVSSAYPYFASKSGSLLYLGQRNLCRPPGASRPKLILDEVAGGSHMNRGEQRAPAKRGELVRGRTTDFVLDRDANIAEADATPEGQVERTTSIDEHFDEVTLQPTAQRADSADRQREHPEAHKPEWCHDRAGEFHERSRDLNALFV